MEQAFEHAVSGELLLREWVAEQDYRSTDDMEEREIEKGMEKKVGKIGIEMGPKGRVVDNELVRAFGRLEVRDVCEISGESRGYWVPVLRLLSIFSV